MNVKILYLHAENITVDSFYCYILTDRFNNSSYVSRFGLCDYKHELSIRSSIFMYKGGGKQNGTIEG